MNAAWPFVAELIELESSPSTSDHARALLLAPGSQPMLPFAVRARAQTRGRGRGRHVWWSDTGSLTVTLALDPAAHGLRLEHEPRLALATAVALVDALESLCAPRFPLGIRWPNDVEAGGKKLAGILPERIQTSAGSRILIGLGVNVLTGLANAPPEVGAMATSLVDLTPAPLTVDTVLRAFLERLAFVLPRLADDDPQLPTRWAALDTLRDQPVQIRQGENLFTGVAQGISPTGSLLVATPNGQRIATHGGQVLREPMSR